ncbi:MAG: hypothetical protein LBN07_03460 [Christensenellaceae bacterium]|jgi:hypothetical protein|nr:hypothetical protein [Christensenellaceae bacterium]
MGTQLKLDNWFMYKERQGGVGADEVGKKEDLNFGEELFNFIETEEQQLLQEKLIQLQKQEKEKIPVSTSSVSGGSGLYYDPGDRSEKDAMWGG